MPMLFHVLFALMLPTGCSVVTRVMVIVLLGKLIEYSLEERKHAVISFVQTH